MAEIPHPPISTPVCPGVRNNDQWTRWFQPVGSFLNAASTLGAVNDNQSKGETLQYHVVGPTIFYTYTGFGGVDFTVNGQLISIPASTESKTITSHQFAR